MTCVCVCVRATVEAQAVLDGVEGGGQGHRSGGQRLHGGPGAALHEGAVLLRRTPKIICKKPFKIIKEPKKCNFIRSNNSKTE